MYGFVSIYIFVFEHGFTCMYSHNPRLFLDLFCILCGTKITTINHSELLSVKTKINKYIYK